MTHSANEHPRGHNRLTDALADVTERFAIANPRSRERWEAAHNFMPGGNTRTVLHYEPFPATMVRGDGSYLYDMDGHRYTDFLGEFSAGLYGHSNPTIKAALKRAIDEGTVLGAPNQWEAKLAQIICERFPSIDRVRFTNSGTEGNLMALGAARAFTKRERIMVFNGAYHGGVLYFDHGGTPVNVPFDIVYAPFNKIEETLAVIEANKNDLAAVIIEPMMGAGGGLAAELPFLKALRKATEDYGIVLIFDEVMTSRSSAGGLQARIGITPDMTTLGKYLGGGCSFGGFGGRHDIMAQFDPSSPTALPHAGTFNNNILSMAAGYAGLSQVFTPEAADRLWEMGESFKERLNGIAQTRGVGVQVVGCGSILGIHMHSRKIRTPEDAEDAVPDRQTLIHLEMMLNGFSYAQRGYMTLNLEMTEADTEAFAAEFDGVLATHSDLLDG